MVSQRRQIIQIIKRKKKKPRRRKGRKRKHSSESQPAHPESMHKNQKPRRRKGRKRKHSSESQPAHPESMHKNQKPRRKEKQAIRNMSNNNILKRSDPDLDYSTNKKRIKSEIQQSSDSTTAYFNTNGGPSNIKKSFTVKVERQPPEVENFLSEVRLYSELMEYLRFLKICKDEQVVPYQIIPDHISQLEERPFGKIQNIIFEKYINILLRQVNKKYEELMRAPEKIKMVERQFHHCVLELRCEDEKRREKYDQDIKHLIDKSDWTTNANEDSILNLSGKDLHKDVVCALGYGLNFGISETNVDPVEIVKGLCQLEKGGDLSCENFHIIKGIVYANKVKPSLPNFPKRFVVALEKLKKDENIHITKSDKSDSIVIMNKKDYLGKMESVLRDEETYTELNKDPTEAVNKLFNNKVKEILTGNDNLIKEMRSTTSTLPFMYGQIETHKPNNPAIPIINFVGSTAHNLSKYLDDKLNLLIGKISDSYVKNEVDLITKLKYVEMNCDFKLVSFVVESLFTKVPIDDLLEFLPEKLGNLDMPVSVEKIIELIELCVKNCKFLFNDKFYEQKSGMSMGNTLSIVLSNLYMEFFESKKLSRILPRNARWYRHLGNVLCIWPCTENIDQFLGHLNAQVPSIRFTMELEKDEQLPFLDCLIYRVDRKFKFDVYEKSTNMSSYVHFYSANSEKSKESLFSSMFLRSLHICSLEYRYCEIERIRCIGEKLKYPSRIIECALQSAVDYFHRNVDKQPSNTKNSLVLPYKDTFNEMEDLLNTLDTSVTLKMNSTIETLLIDNSPTCSRGSVYEIPCKSCNKVYFGQTGRKFDDRIKEHKRGITYGALFNHTEDTGHCIDCSNAEVLVKNCPHKLTRKIIESCLIQENFKNTLNINKGKHMDVCIRREINQKYATNSSIFKQGR